MFVNTKDNWSKKLEDILNKNLSKCNKINKFEVINLGEYGYDIQYSVERYKIRRQKYKPHLILWFLKNDDFEEINEIMRENEEKYKVKIEKNGEYERLIR